MSVAAFTPKPLQPSSGPSTLLRYYGFEVRLLLKARADMEAVDSRGLTALKVAEASESWTAELEGDRFLVQVCRHTEGDT